MSQSSSDEKQSFHIKPQMGASPQMKYDTSFKSKKPPNTKIKTQNEYISGHHDHRSGPHTGKQSLSSMTFNSQPYTA